MIYIYRTTDHFLTWKDKLNHSRASVTSYENFFSSVSYIIKEVDEFFPSGIYRLLHG